MIKVILYNGPRDGEIFAVPELKEWIEVAVQRFQPIAYEKEPSPEIGIPYEIARYRRARKLHKDYHIYIYGPD